jgi:hypothetical protein
LIHHPHRPTRGAGVSAAAAAAEVASQPASQPEQRPIMAFKALVLRAGDKKQAV